jgi:hypothetical protein
MPLPNPSPRREGQNRIIYLNYPLLSWEKGAGGRGNRRRLLNGYTFKTIL